MSNIIKATTYFFNELRWSPENPGQEAIIERLEKQGINLSSLNDYLDQEDFPRSIGRFPEIFSEYHMLPEVIDGSLDKFRRKYYKTEGDSSRKELRNFISLEVAKYLDSQLEAENRILAENGFGKK
jgi:hypothetical protein